MAGSEGSSGRGEDLLDRCRLRIGALKEARFSARNTHTLSHLFASFFARVSPGGRGDHWYRKTLTLGVLGFWGFGVLGFGTLERGVSGLFCVLVFGQDLWGLEVYGVYRVLGFWGFGSFTVCEYSRSLVSRPRRLPPQRLLEGWQQHLSSLESQELPDDRTPPPSPPSPTTPGF